MQQVSQGNRIHIALFGRTNSGKSSLLNALTGQESAIVSDIAGTTTDLVTKPMEIHGLGAVAFLDTPGVDDDTQLGKERLKRTERALNSCDGAVVMIDVTRLDDLHHEKELIRKLEEAKKPWMLVCNKMDACREGLTESDVKKKVLAMLSGKEPPVIFTSAASLGTPAGAADKAALLAELSTLMTGSKALAKRSITGSLCAAGDVVILVMPQDKEAPQGRLILPQVQVLRELLDKGCITVSVPTEGLAPALASLQHPPALIITDSQVFAKVESLVPEGTLLTSFSVLMAAQKGDISRFVQGAKALMNLTEDSRVLIAEACTHAPVEEDIGRVKIPALIHKKFGQKVLIDFVRGTDFPQGEALSRYDLIIQCGSCMFNRSYVLSRQDQAAEAGIPMTNYGLAIASLTGIISRVTIPAADSRV
ncbi:MAG: [FeFe] hydrogenase H-cluster maturation GTPase HydF [Treponemataceae bacterium]|nr:[FeFe] hydrogenase H-cluster maturation GTPase HydF [Treponemataceae bacterium]